MAPLYFLGSNWFLNFFKALYESNREILFKEVDKEIKICYVSAVFVSTHMYGPFRSFEDHEYLKWQKAIMNLNFNLRYTPHPSSISNHLDLDMDWLNDISII